MCGHTSALPGNSRGSHAITRGMALVAGHLENEARRRKRGEDTGSTWNMASQHTLGLRDGSLTPRGSPRGTGAEQQHTCSGHRSSKRCEHGFFLAAVPANSRLTISPYTRHTRQPEGQPWPSFLPAYSVVAFAKGYPCAHAFRSHSASSSLFSPATIIRVPSLPTGQGRPSPATVNASTASQIAQLRRLVAPFHDFDAAVRAGWSAPITPCFTTADLPSQPGVGAMGFHWGNLAYIQDGGAVNLLQPELLLYEPEKNGKLRFVGVEYIVPFTDHPAIGCAADPAGSRFLAGTGGRRLGPAHLGGSAQFERNLLPLEPEGELPVRRNAGSNRDAPSRRVSETRRC